MALWAWGHETQGRRSHILLLSPSQHIPAMGAHDADPGVKKKSCVSLGYTFWCCNKNPTIIWFNKVRVFPLIRVQSIGLIRVCQSFSSHKSPKYRADKSICDTGSFLSTLVGTFIWFHDSYSSMAIMSICQFIRGKVCFIFLKMWPNFYFTCYWPEFWPMATDKEW